VFSSYANAGSLDERVRFFYDDPRGRRLFDERRAIDSRTIDLDVLAALPAGTLGRAYAEFMRSHGLTPDVFDGAPDDIRDPIRAYAVQRLRQTHDLWHVVINAQTDPAGEIALQAFTYAQLHAPSSAILAAIGTLRGAREDRAIVRDAIALYRLGRRAGSLATFLWEDHWATPLVDVRRMLGLPADPQPIGGYLASALRAA
jgi:ubiquinone biosynthesis protein COQ4